MKSVLYLGDLRKKYIYVYSASQKCGHTYSFQGFCLFLLFSTLYNNSEDIKPMKLHIWNHVVTKKKKRHKNIFYIWDSSK